MIAFQASGTDSLYQDQYFNTFWFLIDKFLFLSGGASFPIAPIAAMPMLYSITTFSLEENC